MNEPSSSRGCQKGANIAAAATAAAEEAARLEEAARAAINTTEDSITEINEYRHESESVIQNLVAAIENGNQDEESGASRRLLYLIKRMAIPLEKAAEAGENAAKVAIKIIPNIKDAANAKRQKEKGRHHRGNLRRALRVAASAARAAADGYKRAIAAAHAAKSARLQVAGAVESLILAETVRDDSLIDSAENAMDSITSAIVAVQQQAESCIALARATAKMGSAISEAADADPTTTAEALSEALNSV